MIEITVPKLGMETDDVGIGQVFVGVGDRVVEGQRLAEIETAKTTIELESSTSGVVVEILVRAGEDASIGDVILRIDEAS